jgi:arginyl-tRNA synthetase
MLKEKLRTLVEDALDSAAKDNKFSTRPEAPAVIERPRSAEHGDFACGIALKLAGQLKSAPVKIAETLADYIRNDKNATELVEKLNVVPPGYINFDLDRHCLSKILVEIHQHGQNYGRGSIKDGGKINIEYVSANPTGELHIGHGRNAVYGSSLANLLKFAGYDVTQEFYINDAGEQMLQLGQCAFAIYQNQLGRSVPYPEKGYPEYLIIDFVKQVIEDIGGSLLTQPEDVGAAKLARLTADKILQNQRQLLEKLGVVFEIWYSETTLHERGKVAEVLNFYKSKGTSYEKDGAVFLQAKDQSKDHEEGKDNNERDRVLVKSSGATTYLANDAAYHQDKLARGFTHLINIWGADHHGQVPGIKAAIAGLGEDSDVLEVILTQIVNLSRDGKLVRMSKRAGTVVTLSEVVEEVGVDAVRYYLAETNPQNPITFDLELAKKTSRENPAFYIQYAHARCCSILRRALESSNSEDGEVQGAAITAEQWQHYQESYKADASVFDAAFDSDNQIFMHQKALIMRLEMFPEEVREAAVVRLPGRIARYAYELANDLQKFYEVSRVITDDEATTKARLGIIDATRQVLANALGIVGVSAPERM